jgi:hypothetical protein
VELTDPPDITRKLIMTRTEEFLNDLRTSAWSTSGARFNAARRLKRRDWFATLSIAIFSAIGVGLTIIQKTYALEGGTPIDHYVTALSVCIGLFVIVISLIEWGAGNSVKADALHRNAEELNAFQRELGQFLARHLDGQALQDENIDLLRLKYEEIKIRCPFNHEPIDHQFFLAQRRLSPEFLNTEKRPKICWFRAQWMTFLTFLSIGWQFGFFWIVIALLLWITPWTAG